MAEFIPDAFFKIGDGRDILIGQHHRRHDSTDSTDSSISLSPYQSVSHEALASSLPQSLSHAPVERGDMALDFNPQSPSHPAILITPEDSLLGSSPGPHLPTSPPRSPSISTNSSWDHYNDANQPSILERYIHNHEPHEHLAVSMTHHIPPGALSPNVASVPTSPSAHPISHQSPQYGSPASLMGIRSQPDHQQPPTPSPPRATGIAPHSHYDPIHRYLSSLPAQERLVDIFDEPMHQDHDHDDHHRQQQQQKQQQAEEDVHQQQRHPKNPPKTAVLGSALIHHDPPIESSASPQGDPAENICLSIRLIRELPGHGGLAQVQSRRLVMRRSRKRESDSWEGDAQEEGRVKKVKTSGGLGESA
ncbi:hypothetical protein VTJ83DRAFT_121 [Remersonia thermophila]|uniref:Uncharacterized protein n=1 Tax=Remersonia thermophila TaxID=72144 RepID=A0ABR4DKR8_9PEZI